jgi:hypothetical protein
MTVWQQLLPRSAELLDQSGHAAIDTTYFDRQQASSHYLRRIDRSIKTIQTTFLGETAERQLREQSLSYAAAQSDLTKPRSIRKSPCGTRAAFGAWSLTKALMT